MKNFPFYLCVFILFAILGYVLYLKRNNRKKVNTILYRSLGGMLFLSFCASCAIFDDDELGLLGLICYAWTIILAVIVSAKLFMKKENFWKMLMLYGLIILGLLALLHIEAVAIVTFFIVIYFIYETMAKFIENKLQNRFPSIFNGLATLSLCLFLINIFLFIGIAVYDHRIFGFIPPFWR